MIGQEATDSGTIVVDSILLNNRLDGGEQLGPAVMRC